ncbi:hypothetical protein BJX99DRAFT_225649 [Aspergillus californicus]
MAELAAGVLALAEAGFQLSKTLHDVGSSIVHARKELTELAGELDNFAAVLVSVGEIVQKNSNSTDFQQSDHLVRTTKQVLERCGTEFERIRKMVHLPKSLGNSKSIPKWDRLRWPFRKSKAAKMKVSLEYSKSSLMLMLQTLHLAVGLHALRSLEKISDKTEADRGQEKLLLGSGKDSLSLVSAKEKNGYIKSAQLIVKNTVSAICNKAGQPTLDTQSFDILDAEIKKTVAEYNASSNAFKDKIVDGNVSKHLDSLKGLSASELLQRFPELDDSNDTNLLNEIKDLETDLQTLDTIFIAQKELLKDMVDICNDLCNGPQLLAAKSSLHGVSSLIDDCKEQNDKMIEACKAVTQALNFLISAKVHQRKSIQDYISSQSTSARARVYLVAVLLYLPLALGAMFLVRDIEVDLTLSLLSLMDLLLSNRWLVGIFLFQVVLTFVTLFYRGLFGSLLSLLRRR